MKKNATDSKQSTWKNSNRPQTKHEKKRNWQQTKYDEWISCWTFCVILSWLNVDQREAQFKSVRKRANVVIWRQNRQARGRQEFHDSIFGADDKTAVNEALK